MKELDIKSLAVAALLGGAILTVISWMEPTESSPLPWFTIGAITGFGVQIGVRLTGVS